MIKAKPHEKDGQTWNDVWYVRIPEEDEINQIIFSDVPLKIVMKMGKSMLEEQML